MQTEPKDVIVLGSIRRGKKKFSNIQNETRISSLIEIVLSSSSI